MHHHPSPLSRQPTDRSPAELVQPRDFLSALDADIALAGGELPSDPADEGAVGRTMFDLPTSHDHSVTVLLAKENINELPSQALVRIRSRGDERRYLGTVVAGPFHEPDALRADVEFVRSALAG